MRFWSWLLLGTLAFGLVGVKEAQAAITYQTPGAVAYSGTGGGVTSVAPAYPASIAAGDLLVLIVGQKPDTANGGGVTTPTGWTAITSLTGAGGYGTTLGADTGNTNVFAFYMIAAGGETGTLTVTLTDNNISWAQMYRLSNATGGWSVAGTTGSDTTAGDVSIAMSANPGVTAGDYILGGMVIPTDVTTPSQFSSEALSQTGITFGTVTEISEPDSGTGSDIGGFTFGAPVSSGTASAAPTLTATAGGTTTNVLGPGVFIRCREAASTTLGNGTDPSNASLAPGGAATMADAFTFQTSSGTDTITAVVVGLGTGASAGLSLVEITNDGGTTVYGSTADPASDTPTVTLSTNTLSATTTSTQYKIRVTPKTHANMPAPAGAAYVVTAKINSWTSTNTPAGSDTAGTTITIDNLSPANVTAASGTAGSGQVVFTWTNPADADFNSTVVLRSTTGAVADTPVEGTTYAVGNTIGTSTVACVVASPTATCTNTGLTDGTAYDYKIFTRDTNGNYSATGVVPTGSPYTPAGPGCYSVATGNWGSSSTWADSPGGTPGTCPGTLLGAGVPDATTPAYINFTATSHTVTVNVSNAAATLVRIGAPGTGTAGLAMSSGTLDVGSSVTLVGGSGQKKALLSFTTGTLKVGGTITESGATDVTFGTGTVEYDGTGAQTVATYGYYNLTINKSAGTATSVANITVGNNLTVSSGTLAIAGNTIDRGTAGGTVTVSNGATLQIGGTGDFPANYTTVSLGVTSTIEYYGGNQTVTTLTYGHLALSGAGTKDLGAGTITVAGNFSIASGTTCDANANDPTLNVAGNLTNNGTFTPGTSTVALNGTTAQAVSGVATTFYNLTISNSAGVSASAALTTDGTFTVSSGGVFNAGSSSHSIKGAFSNSGTFNADTSTATFNGTTAQAITGATTFYGLAFSNTAGVTLNNNTTASGALTLTSGLVHTGTNTLIFSSTTTCSVTRTSGYVNGKLRKRFVPTTQIACNFEVGDSNATTHYTPLNVSFAAVSGAGSLTVKVSGGTGASATADDHPQIDAAALDSANSINRYWMLVPADGLTFSNATLTFTHLDDATWVDHDNTANVGRYIVKQLALSDANCYTGEGGYTGTGSWSVATASGTQTVTETAATGVSTFGANCSHFAIGRSTISGFLREREFIFQREINY